jgi:molybdopterin-biosynthesis enzyme MoeA-like protein
MTPQASNAALAAEHSGKASLARFLANQFVVSGFDSEECEPISDREFKMLIALVMVAAVAFGCIVNGGLL